MGIIDTILKNNYTVSIDGGNEVVSLDNGEVDAVSFRIDSPDDAMAKSSQMAYILEISGRIIKQNEAETLKLAQWAQLPPNSTEDKVHRNVSVKLVQGGRIIRLYQFSHAFVVDYNEYIGPEGEGNFKLFVKLNRSIASAKMTISGGTAAE